MHIFEKLVHQIKDARRFGFDYPNADIALDDVVDECREVREDIKNHAPADKIQEEIGNIIYSAIFLCDLCGFDVEETFEKTFNKFTSRVNALKNFTSEHGMNTLQGQSREFMLSLWKKVKELEK